MLGQSLAIGMRALMVAAKQSLEEEEQLSPRQMGVSLAVALVLFIGMFILGPTILFAWFGTASAAAVLTNVLEGCSGSRCSSATSG